MKIGRGAPFNLSERGFWPTLSFFLGSAALAAAFGSTFAALPDEDFLPATGFAALFGVSLAPGAAAFFGASVFGAFASGLAAGFTAPFAVDFGDAFAAGEVVAFVVDGLPFAAADLADASAPELFFAADGLAAAGLVAVLAGVALPFAALGCAFGAGFAAGFCGAFFAVDFAIGQIRSTIGCSRLHGPFAVPQVAERRPDVERGNSVMRHRPRFPRPAVCFRSRKERHTYRDEIRLPRSNPFITRGCREFFGSPPRPRWLRYRHFMLHVKE